MIDIYTFKINYRTKADKSYIARRAINWQFCQLHLYWLFHIIGETAMELSVEEGVDFRIAPNFTHVDMGEYKVSSGRPLYTYGAGPCMNVVLHNCKTNIGGLAHVAVGGWTAEIDLDAKKWFGKTKEVVSSMLGVTGDGLSTKEVVGKTELELLNPTSSSSSSLIQSMMSLFNNSQTSGAESGSEIMVWLGAGTHYLEHKDDICKTIHKTLSEVGMKVTIIDDRKRKGSGDVVYSPFNCRVYIMAERDLETLRDRAKNAERLMAESSKLTKQLLTNYFKDD